MNLHGTVSAAIGSVNPSIRAVLQASTGYTTDDAGKQTPAYAAPVTTSIQVQALTGKDVEHVNNLNLQGVFRAVYLFGAWSGVVRADRRGGDLFTFPETPGGPDRDWLVVAVLESWTDWTKVAVWMQSPGAAS